jgi:hypothetical protein
VQELPRESGLAKPRFRGVAEDLLDPRTHEHDALRLAVGVGVGETGGLLYQSVVPLQLLAKIDLRRPALHRPPEEARGLEQHLNLGIPPPGPRQAFDPGIPPPYVVREDRERKDPRCSFLAEGIIVRE